MFQEPDSKDFRLEGGLNLTSSHLDMYPGNLISCDNVEIRAGKPGYFRAPGYERCAGDSLASNYAALVFEVDGKSGYFYSGETFVCAATGDSVVLEEDELTGGTTATLAVKTYDSGFADGDVFTLSGGTHLSNTKGAWLAETEGGSDVTVRWISLGDDIVWPISTDTVSKPVDNDDTWSTFTVDSLDITSAAGSTNTTWGKIYTRYLFAWEDYHHTLQVTGITTGGTGPYSNTWTIKNFDGTVLATGDLASSGSDTITFHNETGDDLYNAYLELHIECTSGSVSFQASFDDCAGVASKDHSTTNVPLHSGYIGDCLGTSSVNRVNTGAELHGAYNFGDIVFFEQYYNPALDYGTDDFTYAFWLKEEANSSIETIFERSSDPAAQHISAQVNADGTLSFTCDDGTTSRTATGSTAIDDDSWHFIDLSYSAGTLTIRIDGVEDGTATGAALLTLSNTAAKLAIGVTNSIAARTPLENGMLCLFRTAQDTFTEAESLAVYTAESRFFLPSAQYFNRSEFTGTPGTFTFSTHADVSEVTAEDRYAYAAAAQEEARATIPAISSGDSVEGIFRLKGYVYGFCDGGLYKGNGTSWTEITMPHVMYFDSGIIEFTVGDTITDGTETAVVASVTRQEGAWDYSADDQSEGYLTLTSVSGAFTPGEYLTKSGDTLPSFSNGDFATDTVWTKGTGWTIDTGNNEADCDGTQTADSDLTQPFALAADRAVAVTFTVDNYSAGNVCAILGSYEGTDVSADGTYTHIIAAAASVTTLGFRADVDFVGSVKTVSIVDAGFALVTSANEAYTLNSGGRYEFEIHNPTNVESGECVYGADGANDAFQFDGTNYIPIFHPDTTDYPAHILIHQSRSMLVFPGGEWTYSVSGQPRVFNPLLGAGTHSAGAEIVGTAVVNGNVAAAFCEGSYWLLSGTGVYDSTTSTTDYSFFKHDGKVGAEEWSIAGKGDWLFLDQGELKSLKTTDAYGDFSSNPITTEVGPFLRDRAGTVTAAIYVKSKGQYRVFFANGSAAYITFDRGKVRGGTTMSFPVGVSCAYVYYEEGVEYIYFGTDDGYVYRTDSGNSFDDAAITGSFRLPFYNYGSPRHNKQFLQMILELDTVIFIGNETSLTYTINLNHGSIDMPRPIAETLSQIDGSGGAYGGNDGYGNFTWSGPILSEIVAYLEGYGYNMSILVTFSTRYDSEFAFLSAIVDYINLGRSKR